MVTRMCLSHQNVFELWKRIGFVYDSQWWKWKPNAMLILWCQTPVEVDSWHFRKRWVNHYIQASTNWKISGMYTWKQQPPSNPFNAEATLIKGTSMQKFFKPIQTLPSWYSLESSCWVLSDEYSFARVSVIFQVFSHHFPLTKLANSKGYLDSILKR